MMKLSMPKFGDRRSEADRKADEVLKNIRQMKSRELQIANCAGQLEQCRMFFERAVETSRLNALRRQKARISDAAEKERIHDALVGLLATEEAEFELRSTSSQMDLDRALNDLGQLLRQMNRMNPNTSIGKKDLEGSLSDEGNYDNTTAAITFSQRAELVDDSFVDRILKGESLEDCLAQTRGPEPDSFGEKGSLDFSGAAGETKLTPEEERMIRELAGKR